MKAQGLSSRPSTARVFCRQERRHAWFNLGLSCGDTSACGLGGSVTLVDSVPSDTRRMGGYPARAVPSAVLSAFVLSTLA
jgi:hypothetical protein